MEAEIVEKVSEVASASSQANEATTSILPLLANGAGTTVILLSEFAGDILFYRFINVKFPQNFIDFCVILQEDLLPNPYENLNCRQSEMGKFQEFELSACFLENSGHLLNKEALALVLTAISWFLSWLLKGHTRLSKPIIYVRTVLTWNTLINYLLEDFKELTLVAILDLYQPASERRRLSNFDESVGSRFSNVIAIAILVTYVAMYAFFGYLLNRKRKPDPPSSATSSPSRSNILQDQNKYDKHRQPIAEIERTKEEKESKWVEVPRAFNSISSELKNDSWFSRNFLLIFEFSSLLTVLNLVFLQDHGTIQAINYFAINLILLILVVFVYKPFESQLQTRLFAINFFSRLIIGILAILIGASSDYLSNDQIGLTLIALTVTTMLINSLVSIWLILKITIQFCRARRLKSRNKTHPLSQPKRIFDAETSSYQNSAIPSLFESTKFTSPKNLSFDKDSSFRVQIKELKGKSEDLESEEDRPNLEKDCISLCSRITTLSTVEPVFEKVKPRAADSYAPTKLGMLLRKSKSPGTPVKISLDTLSDLSPSNNSVLRLSYFRKTRLSQDLETESETKIQQSKEPEKKIDIIDQLNMIVEDLELLKVGTQNKF